VSPRIALVTPRPPQADGTGDQRRAQDLVDALSPVADLDVVSWLPPGQRFPLPRTLRAWLRLALLAPVRPLQVALTQASCPPESEVRLREAEVVVFVTDRAPYRPTLPPSSVMDFVDDLAAVTARRGAEAVGLRGWFWRMESNRLRRYDRRLLASAAVAVAHSAPDAASIGPGVQPICLPFRLPPSSPGDKILFLGNLYYHPNEEAALWICRELAPELVRRGVPPDRVVVCGRRPSPALRAAARRAGVDLRPDVPDTAAVMAEAMVVLCPTILGTGAITKVIDAVGARRPVVITPLANQGLGLVDGESALVKNREAAAFAEAVRTLLDSPALRISIAEAAYAQMRDYQPEAVYRAWQSAVNRARAAAPSKSTGPGGRIGMLYLKAAAAGRAVAGLVARLADRFPASRRLLRELPIPAKRLIVYRLSTTGLRSSERVRAGGVLYDLDPRDLLQRTIYYNAYERRDLRLALRLTPVGGVCLDVGANIGYYALHLGRKVGPAGAVHAFEPDPDNHDKLVGNCVLNGLDGRVVVNRLALSSRAGEAVLHRQPGRSGDGTLSGFGDGWEGHETVRTEKLDEYLQRNRIETVDFAKIDVEGHEIELLEGASATLKSRSIRHLLIEFNGGRLSEQGETLRTFLAALGRHGYVPAARHRPLLKLLERGVLDPESVSLNLLFRPGNSPADRGPLLKTLSTTKRLLTARVPAKLYWTLMGRFRAVPAVTSGCASLEESLASGRKVVDLLDAAGVLHDGAEVLQIGSGLGRVEKHLASRVARCYGVDISPSMVARARELVPAPNVEFRVSDGRDLAGWKDRELDLVFSIFVFQHLPREQVRRYLAESFRCLKPGGSLVFQILIDERSAEKEPPRSHPYALRHYRRRDLAAALEAAGFRDVRFLQLDGSPDSGTTFGDLVVVGQKPGSVLSPTSR
jgi:FkbM family methyltransferase